MADTIQKYKDYVMTGFVKCVAPIVIDKASGAIVTDVNGREYLDCFAGISVVNSGHGNSQVVAAAKAQMDKLVHCSSYLYHVQPVADLAERIAHIVTGERTPEGWRFGVPTAALEVFVIGVIRTGSLSFRLVELDNDGLEKVGQNKGGHISTESVGCLKGKRPYAITTTTTTPGAPQTVSTVPGSAPC